MSFLSVSVSETRRRMREKAEEEVEKKPAKLEKNKKAVKKMSIVGKLLQLKYRINETAKEEHGWSDDMSTDKRYVQSLINDIRKHKFTKIAPEDAHCCNGLWRKYA